MNFTGKFLGGFISIVLGLVLYVHGQIAIFRVSYLIDAKRTSVDMSSEQYRRLRFDVEQLKAPRLLEQRMKEFQMDLSLPKAIRIIRVAAPVSLEPVVITVTPPQRLPGGVMDFLGRWVKVAQAKMDT